MMKSLIEKLRWLLLVCISPTLLAAPGDLDPDFDVVPLRPGDIKASVEQPDGKIVVAGDFHMVNGIRRSYVARLNSDGTLDENFDAYRNNAWRFSETLIESIAVQDDGKVLVGGYFYSPTPEVRNLIRLNVDGSVDETFIIPTFNVPATIRVMVNAIVTQPGGKILIGGNFSSINGIQKQGLARLDANGALDNAFTTQTNSSVYTIMQETATSWLIGGLYTEIGGQQIPKLARLLENDLLDTDFRPYEGRSERNVRLISVAADNSIYVSGDPPTPSISNAYIHRLNSQGVITSTFNSSYPYIHALAALNDGTVLVSTFGHSGIISLPSSPQRLFKLAADGSLVSESLPSIFEDIKTIMPLSNGHVFVGGAFQYQTGQTPNTSRLGVLKLEPDSLLPDASFQCEISLPTPGVGSLINGAIQRLQKLADGRVAILGSFSKLKTGALLLETSRIGMLEANGELDTQFIHAPHADQPQALISIGARDGIIPLGSEMVVGGLPTSVLYREAVLYKIGDNGSISSGFTQAYSGMSGGHLSGVNDVLTEADGSSMIVESANTSFIGSIFKIDQHGEFMQNYSPSQQGLVYRIIRSKEGQIALGGYQFVSKLNSDGSKVPYFIQPEINGAVYAVVQLPGDRLLIGGDFTEINGQQVGRIAVLNPDGSVDSSFNPGTGADDLVSDIAVRADGEIFVAGRFETFSASPRKYLAQLSSRGELRNTFGENGGPDGFCRALALQTTESMIVAGDFMHFNGVFQYGLAKVQLAPLQPITPPATPSPQIHNTIRNQILLHWEADPTARGYVIERKVEGGDAWQVVGTVYGANGQFTDAYAPYGTGYIYRVRAWNDAGESEPNLVEIGTQPPQGMAGSLHSFHDLDLWTNGTISAVCKQANGKIIIAGKFTQVNGVTRRNIARLNSDGTVDQYFNSQGGPNGKINAISQLHDGRIIIGGEFTSFDGVPAYYLACLYEDGMLEPHFSENIPNLGPVTAVMTDSTDRVFVAGQKWATLHPDYVPFFPPPFANSNDSGLIRLFSNGMLDTAYELTNYAGRINSLIKLPDGKILAAGIVESMNNGGNSALGSRAIMRINDSGIVDSTFNSLWFSRQLIIPGEESNTLPSPDEIKTMAVLSDGHILAGGKFTSINETSLSNLVKLTSNGDIVTQFAQGGASSGSVNDIQEVGGNQIFITGNFVSYANTIKNGFAAIDQNGSLQTSAHAPLFPVAGNKMIPLDTNHMLIAGEFKDVAGQRREGLASISTEAGSGVLTNKLNMRLLQPGSVRATLKQNDGKILVIGDFTCVGGQDTNTPMYNGVLRLAQGGDIDTTFSPPVISEGVQCIEANDSGQIYIGGDFQIRESAITHLALLNSDGELNTMFAPEVLFTGAVSVLATLEQGIVAGGGIIRYSGQDYYLAYFEPDGSFPHRFNHQNISRPVTALKESFYGGHLWVALDFDESQPATGQTCLLYFSSYNQDTEFISPIVDGDIKSLTLYEDESVVFSGAFTTVNGLPQAGFARVLNDFSIDTTFTSPLEAGSVVKHFHQFNIHDEEYTFLVGKLKGLEASSDLQLARIKSDRSYDSSFKLDYIPTGEISSIAFMDTYQLLAGGNFMTVGDKQRIGLAMFELGGHILIPDPVTDLSVDIVAENYVGLKWSTYGNNSTIIERSPADEELWEVIGSWGGTEAGDYNVKLIPASKWKYRAIRFNLAGYASPSNIVSVIMPASFAQWLSNEGLDLSAAPTADPDSDGISLFEEYARGLSADALDAPVSALLDTDSDQLTLTYFKAQPSLHYEVVASENMTQWSSNGVDQGGDGPWVTATVPISGEARKFLRLKISTQAPTP